jgi:ABC-type transport system involved in multi-copper enzyme maturation permease subunit
MLNAFWRKEWQEILREGTAWAMGGLFLFLAAIVPIAFRFLPELWLVELFPSVSLFLRTQEEGASIVFLLIWAVLGSLVMILWGIGSIAYEWRSGQLRLVLAKSSSGAGLLLGKWMADCSLLLLVMGASFFLFNQLCRWFFPYSLAWRPTFFALLLLALYLAFVLALAIFWSAWLRRPGWSAMFVVASLLPQFFLPAPFLALAPVTLVNLSQAAAFSRPLSWLELTPGVSALLAALLLLLLAGFFLSRARWNR